MLLSAVARFYAATSWTVVLDKCRALCLYMQKLISVGKVGKQSNSQNTLATINFKKKVYMKRFIYLLLVISRTEKDFEENICYFSWIFKN